MKLLHITDSHLSDRAGGNRKSSYPVEMQAKLKEVVDLCLAEGRHLVHTGDFFDHKPPRHTSHELTQMLIEEFGRLRNKGLEVIGIPGNHDISEAGLKSLKKQPLGVLQKAGVVRLVMDEYFNGDVLFKGFPYEPEAEHDPHFFDWEPTKQRGKEVDAVVYLTHGALVPDSKDNFNFPTIRYSEIDRTHVDLVLCGHMHDPFETVRIDDTTFVQLGSLSRRSRVQKRDVKVAKIDIDSNGVYVEPYTLTSPLPWQEIFVELGVSASITIDPDLAKLAQDTMLLQEGEDIDYVTVLEGIAPNLKPEVRSLVIKYIEDAEMSSLR